MDASPSALLEPSNRVEHGVTEIHESACPAESDGVQRALAASPTAPGAGPVFGTLPSLPYTTVKVPFLTTDPRVWLCKLLKVRVWSRIIIIIFPVAWVTRATRDLPGGGTLRQVLMFTRVQALRDLRARSRTACLFNITHLEEGANSRIGVF